jgi:biotin carboxyl carrier protein
LVTRSSTPNDRSTFLDEGKVGKVPLEVNSMTEVRKVKVNGTEYEVSLDVEGTVWNATVNGQTFEIEMPDIESVVKPRRSGGRKKKKSGTVSANIPGKVVTVEVTEGQRVEEGQVILILEAMKMQNEIQAPVSGTVATVHCSEGEAIEANVPLVVIEPDDTDEDES